MFFPLVTFYIMILSQPAENLFPSNFVSLSLTFPLCLFNNGGYSALFCIVLRYSEYIAFQLDSLKSLPLFWASQPETILRCLTIQGSEDNRDQ